MNLCVYKNIQEILFKSCFVIKLEVKYYAIDDQDFG